MRLVSFAQDVGSVLLRALPQRFLQKEILRVTCYDGIHTLWCSTGTIHIRGMQLRVVRFVRVVQEGVMVLCR